MFIAPCPLVIMAEGGGVNKSVAIHTKVLSTSRSLGAESVAPHGQYLLTNLHPNCLSQSAVGFPSFQQTSRRN